MPCALYRSLLPISGLLHRPDCISCMAIPFSILWLGLLDVLPLVFLARPPRFVQHWFGAQVPLGCTAHGFYSFFYLPLRDLKIVPVARCEKFFASRSRLTLISRFRRHRAFLERRFSHFLFRHHHPTFCPFPYLSSNRHYENSSSTCV